jgi:hypothetical protein
MAETREFVDIVGDGTIKKGIGDSNDLFEEGPKFNLSKSEVGPILD